jgi:hypothetical protein
MENQNSNVDTSAEARRNVVREMDAREQMVAARREQQRLNILRSLSGYRR